MMKRLLALCLVLAACSDSFAPIGAVPFTPPPAFAQLWQQVEACSGLSGDWHRVEWFTVAGYSLQGPQGPANGIWVSPHRIYIAEDWASDGWLLEHEMLHDLLQRGDHPQQFDACNLRTPVIPMGEL